ncbi:diadenylate cyclase CdaA [Feifania hominis]|uniref:Diadenylate cyclase n=1 Tax=Feifania hominis TaxID=2763660 RepID=A0A926HTR5_9FIRM|nr:diadenylate cyclase CdaA [Feifania hominis]MBC8535160.1 TIGR00159 family protein [Feifania hominis]
MDNLSGFFSDVKSVFLSQLSEFSFFDFLDLVLVAFLAYQLIKLVRETRAAQLIKGVLLLVVLMQVSELLNMNTTYFIMKNSMQFGLLAILIVFQPELRRALEQVGRSKISTKIFNFDEVGHAREEVKTRNTIEAVCTACEHLSRNKIGALMVFERKTMIGEFIKSGTVIDAGVTGELIVSLFFPNNPLHDGAVIFRDNRIRAAGCFLPLTQNLDLSKELGTRHRAGIGISENSDAFVIVVSEETGKISTVNNGTIIRGYHIDSLRETLENELMPKTPKKKFNLPRFLKKKGGEQQ